MRGMQRYQADARITARDEGCMGMVSAGSARGDGARRGGAQLAVTALALALAGCAVGPNYRTPSATRLSVPAQFSADIAVGAEAPSERELGSWWAALGDPLLDRLVSTALAANPDIDAAGARLRQARASYRGARAVLFPIADRRRIDRPHRADRQG